MKRCLCLLGIVLCLCPWRVVAGQGEVWNVYVNPRFGFRIEYPASLKADRPPDNGDGQAFHSADGRVRLVTSGGFLVAFTFEGFWQHDLERYGDSVTYQKKGKSSYVISGVLPSGVEFYRLLAVQGENFADFELTYPHGEHTKYDRWVERIARSYVPFLASKTDNAETEGSNEAESATVVDPDGWTNLRANASTESNIKGRVNAGTQVDIIYKMGKWYLVKTPSGLTGFIHGSRLFDPIGHKMLAPKQ